MAKLQTLFHKPVPYRQILHITPPDHIPTHGSEASASPPHRTYASVDIRQSTEAPLNSTYPGHKAFATSH
ncbi:hypothetical protein IMSAG192_01118 [Muribaculaceae bacterium]|nr:hypothetical protein IMSAG192_01118 [Muribaculaceae bacterium]